MATAAEHRAEIDRINGEVATQTAKIAEIDTILTQKGSTATGSSDTASASRLIQNTANLDALIAKAQALPDTGAKKVTINFTVTGYANGPDRNISWETEEGRTSWFDFCQTELATNNSLTLCIVASDYNNYRILGISDTDYNKYIAVAYGADEIINGTTYSLIWCCFTSGTKVLVSLDGHTRNIEEMRIGDDVISYNVETGENYIAKVADVVININSVDMARVEFANGTVLEMTDYHPIYTNAGWHSITDERYEKLVVGDIAKTIDGWSEVTAITLYTLDEPITTYTLAVVDEGETLETEDDTNDNFYANGIVAHNADCGNSKGSIIINA